MVNLGSLNPLVAVMMLVKSNKINLSVEQRSFMYTKKADSKKEQHQTVTHKTSRDGKVITKQQNIICDVQRGGIKCSLKRDLSPCFINH